ncbi:hypothetical protein FBBAL38_09867 [Flavobacteria bacterium BAL38]|uniref:MbnP family protein n=1 Tax=unclassified Flavobacterium TaxID=196869 RepID=UPI0000F388B4|nr:MULTISPECIES: MbnP family protein [unclassified Flavobacterium]EAZ94736.1 hypothetical protein FBBAL38_09867 [Flavobacteria bacterium BAL38]MQP53234.1 hypothetical protein [Flavobacterium sp. LMO9]MQP62935.1 hypothetical protein [Flavobacterium sp. LMO6]
MNKIIIGFLLLLSIQSNAQKNSDSLYLNINLLFDKQPIELDSNYISKKNDTLCFSSIKFYLTSFEFHFVDNSVFKEEYSYHLIDIENSKTNTLSFPYSNFKNKVLKSVQFNIGVDSLSSVSGALEGDLDATKGMYWAWQSGFINLKIEGKSSSCPTRKNKFQFHVGGYLQPYYAMRNINLYCNDNFNNKFKNQIEIGMDLEKLFSEISLTSTNNIMIPGDEAMKIANLSTKLFSIE